MDFNGAINKIMPEVDSGGGEPFIIYRDKDGYHADFTRNQYGETFEWVAGAMEKDPLAVVYSGKDFSQGSAAFVYDTVLIARVRAGYTNEAKSGAEDAGDIRGLRAIANFFEANIGNLSSETTDYLSTLDNPLLALYELCPSSLATDYPGWTYNEILAIDAIYYIESEISDRLHGYPHEPVNDKRDIDGYTEKLSFPLAGRRVILAENAEADAPYMVCEARWGDPLGALEYRNIDLMCDYVEALRKFVDAADSLVMTLEQERSAFGLAPQILTAADCIPDGLNENLKNKAIVIKPEALAPEYHSAEYQIQICVGGFGASPGSRGQAVFCQNLYSGNESRFYRNDVAGILDPARMPEWAARKLALAEAIKEPGVFGYGGYHFQPVRQFNKGEADRKLKGDSRGKMDMQFAMRNMKDDASLRIDWTDYTHEKFYEVSGSDADIFKCVENGKLYVPCSGKLFSYSEPPQKEKAANKPSLLGRLDGAKAEAARQNAALGDKPAPNRKRGGAEVD